MVVSASLISDLKKAHALYHQVQAPIEHTKVMIQ